MVAQTIRLFVRALIIGILVNIGIQQASVSPLPANPDKVLERHHRPLSQSPAEAELYSSNPAE